MEIVATDGEAAAAGAAGRLRAHPQGALEVWDETGLVLTRSLPDEQKP